MTRPATPVQPPAAEAAGRARPAPDRPDRPDRPATARGRLGPARLSGRATAWVAVVAAVLLSGALLVPGLAQARQRSADLAADLGAGPVLQTAAVVRTAAAPIVLRVPALGLTASLGGLHTDRSGALQVDPDPTVAGWWVDGPAPGDLGPAVLAGHKDSRAGPGVFAHLDRLRPGDRITLDRADDTTVSFAVVDVQTFAKRDFPTARVYQGEGRSTLRIITCGGAYDRSSGRYRSNTVVFADLVDPPS